MSRSIVAAKTPKTLSLFDVVFHLRDHSVAGRELSGLLRFGGPNKVAEILIGVRETLENNPTDDKITLAVFALNQLVNEIFACVDDESAKAWRVIDASAKGTEAA